MFNKCFNSWSILAFAIFLIVSIIHLIKCFKENQKWADYTKFILMPFLLFGFFIFTVFSGYPFSVFHILIILALLFSFMGDAALVFDREKLFFAVGMIFFSAAHICYIIIGAINLIPYKLSIIPAISTAIIFITALAYIVLRMKKQLKGLKNFVIFYGVLITFMSWLFIMCSFSNFSLACILSAIGSLIFIISDALVAIRYFIGNIKKGRFIVMLTYLTAQSLIVAGTIIKLCR